MSLIQNTASTSTPNYLPSLPETEFRYPLAGSRELVVTCHSNCSYSHAILLVGLSSDEINRLTHLIVNAQVIDPIEIGTTFNAMGGGVSERQSAQNTVLGRQHNPLTELGLQSQSGSGSKTKRSRTSSTGGPITRKRITDDELSMAVMIMVSLSVLIDGKSKSEVLEMSGVDVRLWPKVSKQLLDNGQWKATGERRDRRYYWNGVGL